MLGSSCYDAVLDKDVLRVKGVIDLQTFGEGWISVPLQFKQVQIGSMMLDGRPAPLDRQGRGGDRWPAPGRGGI